MSEGALNGAIDTTEREKVLEDLRKASEGLCLTDSTLLDLLEANKKDLEVTVKRIHEMKGDDPSAAFNDSEETGETKGRVEPFVSETASMNKKEVVEILEKVRGFGTSSAEWTWQENEQIKEAPNMVVVRNVAREIEENRQMKANMDAAEDVWERQKRMKARRQQRKIENQKTEKTPNEKSAPLGTVEEQTPQPSESKSEKDDVFLPPERPPLVVIYSHSGSNPSLLALSKIRAVFTLNDVDEKDIREIDVTNDFEMQSVLQQQSNGNPHYPLIAIHGRLVGDFQDLMKAHTEETLKDLLALPNADESDDDEDSLRLNVFDQMLDAGEYVVAGVGYAVTYPFAVLSSWAFGTPSQEETPKEQIVDFKVIHCNWYWRHLRRIFRFTPNCIQRIHPKHMEIRASHPYESILTVKVLNDSNAILEYQQSSPDYFAARPSDLREMIQIIVSKNPRISVNVMETMKEEASLQILESN